MKTVFLDRDGVINRDNKNYTFKKEDFYFNEGVFEALKEIQFRNYSLICITNQAGIAKGLYSHQDVQKVHQFMTHELRKHHIEILDTYYCPHYHEISECLCRKPKPLLIEKAIARFGIEAQRSYFIGDRTRDMEAAIGAGIKGILIDTNQNLNSILHLIP
ncbi:MAG: HAD family hydrolase [Bacteroidia bacterium]|nr:HAD family hydrolase [Bacteroidia bacterium]MCZ2276913.1 HAD family hydrolase [Bacteroidia bacterium]